MSAALVHIVAVSQNGVIGRDGAMPWRLSSDLKRFRALSLGKPVIMGRKTFSSIGRALDGRDNIVVTRDDGFAVADTIRCATIDDAIAKARVLAAQRGGDEIAIIGGGQIYAATLGIVTRIYLTRVHATLDGDTHYPPLEAAVWREISREDVPAGARDSHATTFMVLERQGG